MILLEDVAALPAARGPGPGESAPPEDALPPLRPLGEGLLPRGLVLELLARCVPPETPLVVRAESLERQRAWLGME